MWVIFLLLLNTRFQLLCSYFLKCFVGYFPDFIRELLRVFHVFFFFPPLKLLDTVSLKTQTNRYSTYLISYFFWTFNWTSSLVPWSDNWLVWKLWARFYPIYFYFYFSGPRNLSYLKGPPVTLLAVLIMFVHMYSWNLHVL